MTADVQRPAILKNEQGKPYFDGCPVHFSISHTEKIWACAMWEHAVGIDIQSHRKVDCIKLSKRFFAADEAEYVRIHGEEGFFNLWRRKEAYVKYKGTGIGLDFAKFSTVEDGIIKDQIEGACLWEVCLDHNLRCAVCAERTEEICVITIA